MCSLSSKPSSDLQQALSGIPEMTSVCQAARHCLSPSETISFEKGQRIFSSSLCISSSSPSSSTPLPFLSLRPLIDFWCLFCGAPRRRCSGARALLSRLWQPSWLAAGCHPWLSFSSLHVCRAVPDSTDIFIYNKSKYSSEYPGGLDLEQSLCPFIQAHWSWIFLYINIWVSF